MVVTRTQTETISEESLEGYNTGAIAQEMLEERGLLENADGLDHMDFLFNHNLIPTYAHDHFFETKAHSSWWEGYWLFRRGFKPEEA